MSLQWDPEFRYSLTSAIRNAPFEAVYFEMPPITAGSLRDEFEFALIDAPSLASNCQLDQHAFAQHFQRYERRSYLAQ